MSLTLDAYVSVWTGQNCTQKLTHWRELNYLKKQHDDKLKTGIMQFFKKKN